MSAKSILMSHTPSFTYCLCRFCAIIAKLKHFSHISYLALCGTALLIPAPEPHSTQEAVTLSLCLPYSLLLQL